MRIALAGGGGFAYILAQELCKSANTLLVLSRQEHPEFEEDMPESQVVVVDYSNVEELHYTLQGIDLVISTISGAEQLNLIDAARRARVRVFVPSEFEGSVFHRPGSQASDPLDRGSHAALNLLRQISQAKPTGTQYTVFSCGLFMERFGPGGLQAHNLGASTGVQAPSDYLVNVSQCVAEIVESSNPQRPAQVALTSVYDVARFVAAAIELGLENWPREFKMRGDHMSVSEVVRLCSVVRGVSFVVAVHKHQDALTRAEMFRQAEDWTQWHYLQRLIATANGRYHFRQANLNEALTQAGLMNSSPMKFRQWLEAVWGSAV